MNKMQTKMLGFSKTMKKHFGGVGKDITKLSKGIDRAAIGIGASAVAAVVGIAIAANKATEAWNHQAAAIASVEATLLSTGGTVGRSLAQLEAQASSIQKNTFIGDEAILQGVTAQMLTFTNITGSAFDRAQQAVVDVSAKLNGLNTSEESLRATTIALSKALNDPVANLGALSRSGIQFSVTQKAMIKRMVESGKITQAQDIILTEIEKQYGGTAAAIAKTTAGLKLQEANLRGDSWELLGKAIEPVVKKLLEFRIQALDKINPLIDKLSAYISENADRFGEWLDKVDIGKLIDSMLSFGRTVIDVVKFVSPLAPMLLTLVVAIKAVAVAMAIYNSVMMLNPTTWIIVAIIALIAAIVLIVQYWEEIVAAMQPFIDIGKEIWAVILEIGQAFMAGLLAPINLVIDAIVGLLSLMSKIPGMSSKLAPALGAIKGFQSNMNEFLTGNAAPAYASPTTYGAESRSYSESRSVSEVFVRPERGAAVSTTPGGPAQPSLSYGRLQ